MAESSLARSAHEESPELVECFRHQAEECPRCDGSGYRPVKHCAGCGEAAGSVSEGTGFPLMRDRRGDERLCHVRCLAHDGWDTGKGYCRVYPVHGEVTLAGRMCAATSPRAPPSLPRCARGTSRGMRRPVAPCDA